MRENCPQATRARGNVEGTSTGASGHVQGHPDLDLAGSRHLGWAAGVCTACRMRGLGSREMGFVRVLLSEAWIVFSDAWIGFSGSGDCKSQMLGLLSAVCVGCLDRLDW